MSVTDEIKSRIDIVNYVQQYVPSLKKAGRYYKACCPFHGEKNPSFVVNPDNQTWRCFGSCAIGGDLFSFAEKLHGWDFKEALQELGRQAGVEIRQQTPEQKSEDEKLDRLRGMLTTAADFYHDFLFHENSYSVLQYASEKRAFTPDTIKTFKIGYAADSWQDMLNALVNLGYSEDEIIEGGLAIRNDNGRVYDRFRNRLMIPIRDERGRVVGFGGRVLNPEDNPKYMNSPQTPVFDKSHLLFGLDTGKSAIRNSETVVIVEGYMDAIQAYQAGYQNVVAQMGTAMTETQLKLLAPKYAKKIILALDADDAGQNATRRSLEVARQTLAKDYAGKLSVDIRVLQIPGAKDPDDFLRESPDGWQPLVDNAKPVADFVIDMEMAGLPRNASLQERQNIAGRILPILLASENNLYKQDNIQKLALRLRINEADLLAWAQEQLRIETSRTPRQAPPPKPVDIPPLDYPDLPPEYFGDDDFIPPEFMDMPSAPKPAVKEVAKVVPQPAVWQKKHAIEGYCLRLLIQNPKLLYNVNRKLRELAGNSEELITGPLRELSLEDFSQSQYRVLMKRFEQAIAQDDLEPIDYLRSHLEEELMPDFEALLREETETVSLRVQNRLKGDFDDIYKNLMRHGKLNVDVQSELVKKALSLRAERLQREREDMFFLQKEIQMSDEGDKQGMDHFAHQIALSITAKLRLDTELH